MWDIFTKSNINILHALNYSQAFLRPPSSLVSLVLVRIFIIHF